MACRVPSRPSRVPSLFEADVTTVPQLLRWDIMDPGSVQFNFPRIYMQQLVR